MHLNLSPKAKKRLFALLLTILSLALVGIIALLGINFHIVSSTSGRILTAEEAAKLPEIDCILVLGCGVKKDGTPSDMLRDRLTMGMELYDASAAPKLLMTGDHHTVGYNEVQVMKDFAIAQGAPSGDVFMDHAGLNTYDSLWRAREVFQAKRILIVTQEYHLPRALHIASSLGIEAWGVGADYHTYRGQFLRDLREVLARNKDFFLCLLQPEASIPGPPIPITGDGDLTND